MNDNPNDPFYIPPFCRRVRTEKSEEPMFKSYHNRQVFAAEAATGTDEAPAKPARKAKPAASPKDAKARAKASGKAKVPAGNKAHAKAKAAAKGKPKAKAKRAAPRVLDPAKLDQYGFRKGTLKSRAAAMYASKKGATLAEVKAALDSTQFNLLTQLEEQGFTVERTQVDGDGPRKVTRYKLGAKK